MTDEKRTAFLVLGPMCWGKGFSKAEAIRAARTNLSSRVVGDKPVKAKLLQATPETTVNGMGALEWPIPADVQIEISELNQKSGELRAKFGNNSHTEAYADRIEELRVSVEPAEVEEIVLHLGNGNQYRERLEDLCNEMEHLLYTVEEYRQEKDGEEIKELKEDISLQLDEIVYAATNYII